MGLDDISAAVGGIGQIQSNTLWKVVRLEISILGVWKYVALGEIYQMVNGIGNSKNFQ